MLGYRQPIPVCPKTELLLDGKVIDVLSQNIGFRTAVFSPEEGFLLNGRHVKLHGYVSTMTLVPLALHLI